MNRRVGTGELILLVAFMTATGALAIDQMLPAFPEMRLHFGLDEDSTRLSLAAWYIIMQLDKILILECGTLVATLTMEFLHHKIPFSNCHQYQSLI